MKYRGNKRGKRGTREEIKMENKRKDRGKKKGRMREARGNNEAKRQTQIRKDRKHTYSRTERFSERNSYKYIKIHTNICKNNSICIYT